MKIKTKLFIFLLAFIPIMAMATHFQVSDESDISARITSLKAGDTLSIDEGFYQASRIYAIRNNGTPTSPIVIRGAGIRKTIISGHNGKGIRLFGNYIILEHLTLTGGGDPLEITGHHNTARFFSSENSNIGVKISGDHILIHDAFIYSNQKTGMEVNGGFYFNPDWSNSAIRVRAAIGEVPSFSPEKNAENRAKWNPEQLAFFDELWGNRNMDVLVRRVFFHDNGYNRYDLHPDGWKYGQALYGGAVKAVPNVSGLKLDSCVVLDNGFSSFWWDEPSKGFNEVSNCIVVNAHHGVHVEIGLDPENHKITVKNNIFWNVHQGIFNSASGQNLYENNIINAFKYGIVNHGIKGNRTERKTVATYKNNVVFLETFVRNRVGDFLREKPKGHMVWFSGQNSIGSKRQGNTFVLTDSFPELKISNSVDQGYSFSSNSLGSLHQTEKTEYNPEVQNLALDGWPLELPLFSEYFYRDDITFDGQVIQIPIDTTIIPDPDPIDTTIIPDPDPIAPDDREIVIFINDFAKTRVDKDCEPTSAFLNLFHSDFKITEVISGHKWKLTGSLAYYNQLIGSAYYQERDALNSQYPDAYPETLDVIEASTNGIGFTTVTPSTLNDFPSIKYEVKIIVESSKRVNVMSGGTASEVATLVKYIISYEPEHVWKLRIFTHGVIGNLVNRSRDVKAAEYLEKMAGQGIIKYIKTGQAGMKFIDDRSAPNMPSEIFDSKIGSVFLNKSFVYKSDFSDAVMLILLMKILSDGEAFIETKINQHGQDNTAEILKAWKGKKSKLYELIKEKCLIAANGEIIIDIPDPDPDPDPDPSSWEIDKAKAIKYLEEIETRIDKVKILIQNRDGLN